MFFCGNSGMQKYDLKCWLEAMDLRKVFAIPKIVLAPSQWVKFYNPRNSLFKSIAKTVMAGEKEADHASIIKESKDFHEI